MFGYIICNEKGLTEEERERYKKVYCGVCRDLAKRFGQAERITLNFDMTFLALFLNALYEPEEQKEEFCCPAHPFHKKEALRTLYTAYAADMTIALAYHKCLDDWADEKRPLRRAYGTLLEKHYKVVKEKYPRQCNNIEESLQNLSKIEKESPEQVDEAIRCSGRMLSEIFVLREDFWSNSLRRMGYELGRFIYLMDAAMDFEKDKKKGSYNPLVYMDKKPAETEELLTMFIGNATEEFEKLPIVQDERLLQNILYGGVWQQYYGKVKEKQDGNESVSGARNIAGGE